MKLGRMGLVFLVLILISLIFTETFCQCKLGLTYKSKSHICLSCRLKKLIGVFRSLGSTGFLFFLVLKIGFFRLGDGSLYLMESKFPVLLKVRMNQ